MSTLIIVESPGKTRSIEKYLGAGYTVIASVGHIRDLPDRDNPIPDKYKDEPWAAVGIEPGTFRPIYVVNKHKRDVVAKIRSFAARADRVLLAMDADREGEAIAWHVAKVAGLQNPQRITFTEITQDALQQAVKRPRPLDMHLVSAQETRRIVDRLVGYGLSPLLWRSVQRKTDEGQALSAGRVQSAALMLVASREMARMSFIPAGYWVLRADADTAPPFTATVVTVRTREHPQGKPLAKASDYSGKGVLKEGADVLTLTAEQARAVAAALGKAPATVSRVKSEESPTRPPPPFVTATLQKAARSVGLDISGIMQVAQELYEQGYITYMRTDSPSLSEEALLAARAEVVRLFGEGALPPRPRQYAARDKNAQEAHEAIRPAGASFRPPDTTDLEGDHLAVYTLIYNRCVASQMQDAIFARTTVTLSTRVADLEAKGKMLLKPGFLALTQTRPEGDEDDTQLPELHEGQQLRLTPREPENKQTTPPPRYTEGTLVDALKAAGIGRPSTYEALIATLERRTYTVPIGDSLAISAIGLLVTTYLARQVPNLIAKDFTATMEADLDAVAAGRLRRTEYLERFWTQGLEQKIAQAEAAVPDLPLPHLEDTRLRSTPSGPHLHHAGRSAPLPTRAVPGDFTMKDVQAILQGTWKPPVHKKAGRKASRRKSGGEEAAGKPRKTSSAPRKAANTPTGRGTRKKSGYKD